MWMVAMGQIPLKKEIPVCLATHVQKKKITVLKTSQALIINIISTNVY